MLDYWQSIVPAWRHSNPAIFTLLSDFGDDLRGVRTRRMAAHEHDDPLVER